MTAASAYDLGQYLSGWDRIYGDGAGAPPHTECLLARLGYSSNHHGAVGAVERQKVSTVGPSVGKMDGRWVECPGGDGGARRGEC